MKKIILLLLVSLSINAGEFHKARSAGKIIELDSGYADAPEGATSDIKKLVKDVNEKRKAAYTKIAAKTGVKIDQVASKAAIKIKAKLKK